MVFGEVLAVGVDQRPATQAMRGDDRVQAVVVRRSAEGCQAACDREGTFLVEPQVQRRQLGDDREARVQVDVLEVLCRALRLVQAGVEGSGQAGGASECGAPQDVGRVGGTGRGPDVGDPLVGDAMLVSRLEVAEHDGGTLVDLRVGGHPHGVGPTGHPVAVGGLADLPRGEVTWLPCRGIADGDLAHRGEDLPRPTLGLLEALPEFGT